jgi:hypothetical protein
MAVLKNADSFELIPRRNSAMTQDRKGKKRIFNFFRYQILPKIDPTMPQMIYTTPDHDYRSVDELRTAKNSIFTVSAGFRMST